MEDVGWVLGDGWSILFFWVCLVLTLLIVMVHHLFTTWSEWSGVKPIPPIGARYLSARWETGHLGLMAG